VLQTRNKQTGWLRPAHERLAVGTLEISVRLLLHLLGSAPGGLEASVGCSGTLSPDAAALRIVDAGVELRSGHVRRRSSGPVAFGSVGSVTEAVALALEGALGRTKEEDERRQGEAR